MIEGTCKLTVDVGNSETRVGVQYGKSSKTGLPQTRVVILSNGYSPMEDTTKIPILKSSGNYAAETSRILKYGEGYYCNGEIADTEYGMYITRPTSYDKKYESDETMKAIINALCQGIMEVAEMNSAEPEDVYVSWEVSVLLPPGNVEDVVHTSTGDISGAAFLAQRIKAIKHIDFELPELHADVDISKVTVYPEGHCAFMAVLFEHKGVMRNDYKYLVTSPTMIIDIGAGTSDICVVENGKTLINTRFTTELGGNNVHTKVNDMLKADGIKLYDADVRRGVVTGYVYDGAKKVHIERKIAMAKQQVANQLVSNIQAFFESRGYPPQKLANLLVCGGGAERGESEYLNPISDYIVHYMRKLSPNIQSVPYPMVTEGDEQKEMSPRLMNIYGAMILAE